MEQTGKRKEILLFYVRILVWIAALVALFSMAANLPVLAAETIVDDTEPEDFLIIDNVLAKYQGSEEIVIIPEGITEIGSSAFYSCKTVKKVIIPEGVIKIGSDAFWNCENLTEIQIPSTVTDPGNGTTYALTPWLEAQLKAVPEESPFLIVNQVLIAAKKGLEIAVTVPDEVVRIADKAFQRTRFTSITISDSVTEIGNTVFECCYWLEKVYMPDSVKSLGRFAFYECKALKEVRLSNSIKLLEEPFYKCNQLKLRT